MQLWRSLVAARRLWKALCPHDSKPMPSLQVWDKVFEDKRYLFHEYVVKAGRKVLGSQLAMALVDLPADSWAFHEFWALCPGDIRSLMYSEHVGVGCPVPSSLVAGDPFAIPRSLAFGSIVNHPLDPTDLRSRWTPIQSSWLTGCVWQPGA